MTLKQRTQHSPSSNWTHFQRTVPDASELFEPLENAIRHQLILALVGQEFCDAERQILALPLRHGGLGLTDPRETAKMEYEHSTQITNKQPKSTLKSSILTTTPRTSSSPDTQKTEYNKRKIQKHPR